METEFIYWRHRTPAGIKVEEVSGAEDKSGKLWREMALQIYCENGKEGYRQIGHYQNGAPLLEGEECRVSLTHTTGLLAVATLPRTPEADLRIFSPRTAMGIDAERCDREQVLKVRERFLSDEEMAMVDEKDVRANVLAWTIKEALYKGAMTSGLDLRSALRIVEMPPVHENPALAPADFGKGEIIFPDGTVQPMHLFSWISDEVLLTLAFSPSCAKFKSADRN